MRVEVHVRVSPPPRAAHLLLDEEALKQLQAVEPDPLEVRRRGELITGTVGQFTGVPIYIDECPCSEVDR